MRYLLLILVCACGGPVDDAPEQEQSALLTTADAGPCAGGRVASWCAKAQPGAWP